jgi:hypothetical protein
MPDRFEKRLSILRDEFEELGIEYFSAKEIVTLNNPQWEYRKVFPPPKRLISNILPTIKIADEIREEWGGPVSCLSGWRPPTYNDLIIEGSDDSQHMYFRALDLQPINEKYEKFIDHVSGIVSEKGEEGKIIGYGRYNTFVHIDTGFYEYNRNWDQRD